MKGCIINRKNKKGKKQYYVIVDEPVATGQKRKQKWSKPYATKKDAESDLPRILLELQDSNYVSSVNLLFSTVIQNYLSKIEGEVAKSTLKRYTSCCRLIDTKLGKYPIKKIEPHYIQKFFADLKQSNYKPNTIQKYKAVLQQIMNYAIELRLINFSPVPKLKVSTTNYQIEHETWDAKQLHNFLQCIKDEPLYIPVLIAGTTAMRSGEIVGLKWKDIDFETKTVYVQRTKVFDNSLKTTKSKTSKRAIKLMDWVVDELKRYKLTQSKNKLQYGKDYIKTDFVCTHPNGKPLDTNYVAKTFPRKIKQHQCTIIRFHDLRHSFATIALTQGIHVKVVQEILGHSDIKVTLNTYSHVLPVMHQDSIDKITKAFTS